MSNYRYYYFANLDEAHKFADIFEKYVGKPVDELDEVCDWRYLNDPVSVDDASGTICIRLEIKYGYETNRVGAVDFNYLNFPEDGEFEVVEDKMVIPWRAIGVGCAIFALGVIFAKRNAPVRITEKSCRHFIGKNPLLGPFSYEESKMLEKLVHSMDDHGLIFAIDPKLARRNGR